MTYKEWVEELIPEVESWQVNIIIKEFEHLYECCENLEQFVADAYKAHPNLDLDIESWKKQNDD